ncbi:MAG: hypothetical protein HC818_00280 [Synechococcaceae cyanobacterium RM1_1_27]|nr:hypothetical protein [Synechococcaceae cyanobacterium RM1_1_27]
MKTSENNKATAAQESGIPCSTLGLFYSRVDYRCITRGRGSKLLPPSPRSSLGSQQKVQMISHPHPHSLPAFALEQGSRGKGYSSPHQSRSCPKEN